MKKRYLFILVLGMAGTLALSLAALFNFKCLLASYEERRRLFVQEESLHKLLAAIKDAEISQRSYLLTGKSNYLEPYYSTLHTLDSYLSQAQEGSLPSQIALYQELSRLIKMQIQSMSQSIDKVKSEGITESQKKEGGVGSEKRVMDNIGSLIVQLTSSAESERGYKEADIEQSSDRSLWTMIGSVALVNFIVGFYSYLFYRDSQRSLKTSKELNQTSHIYQTILDTTRQVIIRTDNKGVIVSFNKKAEKMLGYRAQEVIHKTSILNLYDKDNLHDKLTHLYQRPIELPIGFDLLVSPTRSLVWADSEWLMKKKNGNVFPCLLSITALRDEQNQVIGFLFMASDLTQDKKLEEHVKVAHDAMEAAYLSRNKFLSSLGHDFRPPLTTIVNGTNLLLRTKSDHLNVQERTILAQILTNSQQVLNLTNRIVELSKIEGGLVSLNPKELTLDVFIEKIIKEVEIQQLNRTKQVQFQSEIPHSLKPLETDPEKLHDILINLIQTALAFQKTDQIIVHVKADPQTLCAAEIDIMCLEDGSKGKTVKESKLQVKPEREALSLSLAQSIAKVLGYRVTVSKRGEGMWVYTLVLSPRLYSGKSVQ
ncbi:putative sensory histidine kinase [Candidatus Protochlamydia naegleriophila]|uniref:histidine kinase n=1 Tax=Candidatus Protochlamydia naegleriophila TaxID=389348 RepID=A0A0U5JA97_9BACT|nr:CHASE3 domain-containing protein [Candidatus Protochlamydia naegleriophila]CUI16350.1 putative sensory histidine kinase [Candidatus Protochlamydia naegleriophila]